MQMQRESESEAAGIKPTFIIFGVARCGSTLLWNVLNQHPDIYQCSAWKEPNFFMKNPGGELDFNAYLSLFSGHGGRRAIGEGSVSYMYYPYVAPRIAGYLPDVRLVAILRNPMKRAYSDYLLSIMKRREWLTFRRAIETEDERIVGDKDRGYADHSYIDRGRYYSQLCHYLRYFPSEQIHIVMFEEFVKNQAAQAKKIFEFLNVDSSFEVAPIPREDDRANASTYPKYPKAFRTLGNVRRSWGEKRGLHRLARLAGKLEQMIPFTPEIPPISNADYDFVRAKLEGEIRGLAAHPLGGDRFLRWLE